MSFSPKWALVQWVHKKCTIASPTHNCNQYTSISWQARRELRVLYMLVERAWVGLFLKWWQQSYHMTQQFYSGIHNQEKWELVSHKTLYMGVHHSIFYCGTVLLWSNTIVEQKLLWERVETDQRQTEECISKLWHDHAVKYYSAIKGIKYRHMPHCGWTSKTLA